MIPCGLQEHPWGSFASSLWGGGTCSTEWARSSLQESALGAGRGGSAPALAEAGPGSVPPEHSDVSGQLTSRVSLFNLLNCLQQIEGKWGRWEVRRPNNSLRMWQSRINSQGCRICTFLNPSCMYVSPVGTIFWSLIRPSWTSFLKKVSKGDWRGMKVDCYKIDQLRWCHSALWRPAWTREHKWPCRDPSVHVFTLIGLTLRLLCLPPNKCGGCCSSVL